MSCFGSSGDQPHRGATLASCSNMMAIPAVKRAAAPTRVRKPGDRRNCRPHSFFARLVGRLILSHFGANQHRTPQLSFGFAKHHKSGTERRSQHGRDDAAHAAMSLRQRRLCSRQYTAPGCATGAVQKRNPGVRGSPIG